MPSLTPEEFAKRWAGSELSERSSYQQHFLDLCEMFAAPKHAESTLRASSTPSRRASRQQSPVHADDVLRDVPVPGAY